MTTRSDLLWTTWSWAALTLLVALCIAISGVMTGTSSSVLQRALPFLIWAAASPLVIYVTRRRSHLVVHVATLLAISLAGTLPAVGTSGLRAFVSDIARGKPILDLSIYAAIVATVSFTGAFDRIRLAENTRRSIERDIDDARLRLARAAIPLSFLRSMFDSIEDWIARDTERAENIGLRSAVFLRGLLDAHSAVVWNVGRELDLIESYFALDAARGRNAFLRIDIRQAVRSESVPAGALQSAIFAAAEEGMEAVTIRADDEALLIAIDAPAGASSTRIPFEHGAVVSNDERVSPPVRRFSTRLAFAGVIGFVLLIGVCVQLAERPTGSAYIPWAMLRTSLSAMLPLALAVPLHRRGHPTPILFVVVAVAAAIIGELSFFAILGAMEVPGVPPMFTTASVAIALDSVALGAVLNLSLLLLIERLLVLRDELRNDERRMTLEVELSRAHLGLLRSQIRPHFLFNALNSLLALIPTDSEGSLRMLSRLRSFYSKAAAADRAVTVTIAEELAMISEYLDIERVRFGERLTSTIEIDPATTHTHMPSLLLQPLVENAIKHGIAKHAGAGWITIRTLRNMERVEIEICNNAVAPAGGRVDGVGLANTSKRLHAAYGSAATFETWIEPGGVNMVRILLPAS